MSRSLARAHYEIAVVLSAWHDTHGNSFKRFS
jgi:hypothetical protein